MEVVSLEEIIESIEKEDPDTLADLLKHGSPHINDYVELEEDQILMTPLLYAIKMKSPECVDVLVFSGADTELSIKMWDPEYPDDESKQKSLIPNALAYAMGEKKKADGIDASMYEEIIEIIKEAKAKAREIAQHQPKVEPVATAPQLSTSTTLEGVSNPSITDHRVAQKIFQNQIDIKKLKEENQELRKEIKQLHEELERFRPWIERWIYQEGSVQFPSKNKKRHNENANENGETTLKVRRSSSLVKMHDSKKAEHKERPKTKERTKVLVKQKSAVNHSKTVGDRNLKRGSDIKIKRGSDSRAKRPEKDDTKRKERRKVDENSNPKQEDRRSPDKKRTPERKRQNTTKT